jgi:hypothetical protein
MTSKERAEIKECLRLIFEEERDTEAYLRLCRLVGMRYPAGEAMKSMRQISVAKMLRETDTSFAAPNRKGKP